MMQGRDALQKDKKKMREVISEYKVLRLDQFKILLKDLEPRIIKTIFTFMVSDNTLYIFDDICSTKEDWQHYYDPDVIKAFWVLLDNLDDIRHHIKTEPPAKLLFMTDRDTYDVIVAHKGEENLINMYYQSFADERVKHLIVVDSKEQMTDFEFNNIFAYCIVSDDGQVTYYRNEG